MPDQPTTRPDPEPRPLLGVAGHWGAAEIALARRFDDLHQLLYVRGGIRPSNAAVEEIAKLVLVRLWSLTAQPDLFDDVTPDAFTVAFARALTAPALQARDLAGRAHPVWPLGEPFRLTEPALLTAAARLVADIVGAHGPAVSDPLGTAFDALLAGRYDHAGGLGTYLTPSGVARMMAEVALSLVDISAAGDGPGFGDPYCGTGRFLVAALEVLREAGATDLLRGGPFGTDQSTSAVAKARINMLLYGVRDPLVWTVRDSVTDAGVDRLRGTVSLLLTNPPFGEGKYDDPDGVGATVGAIPRLRGRQRLDPSLVGLVRSVGLLAPGGVLGIVLPDGVVASAAFADLVLAPTPPAPTSPTPSTPVSLVACVSLPTATFALSGTVAKTSAVFLRRSPRPARVALARVEHVGYVRQSGRAAADPRGNQLPAVSAAIRAGLSSGSAPDHVTLVEPDALRTLDPSTLDTDALAARQWLVERGGTRLRELLSPVSAPRARTVSTPFVSVLHVDDLGTVDWPAAREHTPTTPGLLVEPGQLIVSLLNPAKPRAAVIPPGDRVQVSAEFGVFRAAVDPYAVLGLLYSPRVRAQLRPLGTGTSSSRRRITADDVLDLVIPALAAADLAALADEVRSAVEEVGRGRERLRHTFLRT